MGVSTVKFRIFHSLPTNPAPSPPLDETMSGSQIPGYFLFHFVRWTQQARCHGKVTRMQPGWHQVYSIFFRYALCRLKYCIDEVNQKFYGVVLMRSTSADFMELDSEMDASLS